MQNQTCLMWQWLKMEDQQFELIEEADLFKCKKSSGELGDELIELWI